MAQVAAKPFVAKALDSLRSHEETAGQSAARRLRREVHVYRNAGHGFANPKGKNFHSLAADDAWGKLKAFFDKHLKGA